MRNKKHIRFAIAFLVPLAFVFSQCFHQHNSADPRGEKYAGTASCLKCHKSGYQNFLHSTHFRSSRAASEATVSGSFQPGSNNVDLNDSIKVVMEKHPNGLYQAAYTKGKLIEKERFDIAIGSYRGETYLSWKGSEARQLPITYYVNMHQWANSPGYSADSANFKRVIGRRCFECHSSYIQNIAKKTDSAEG
ncbi:MAG: hypothetical protein M3N14_12785, partial [Bacteroidota bacterium]|nr:hypothetical protein [Bacteroidota bacterium]